MMTFAIDQQYIYLILRPPRLSQNDALMSHKSIESELEKYQNEPPEHRSRTHFLLFLPCRDMLP